MSVLETPSSSKIIDLAIIGAGPAGVEAALQAAKRGISYILFEKDSVGALIANTMAAKKFYHVYGRNTAVLKGDLAFPDRMLGLEIVELWRKQAEALSCEMGAELRSLVREGDHFIVETSRGHFEAKQVLLTSGTFESPRRLNVPGEEGNSHVRYRYDYYEDYNDADIIVVGGGNSAVETALYLAPNNRVTLIVRKPALATTVTDKNRLELEDLVREGKLVVHYESTVLSLDAATARVSVAGAEKALPYAMLFVHIGFDKPDQFLKNLGVELRESLGGFMPVFNEKFETNVPGLFIAGALTGADSVIESANQAYDIVHSLSME